MSKFYNIFIAWWLWWFGWDVPIVSDTWTLGSHLRRCLGGLGGLALLWVGFENVRPGSTPSLSPLCLLLSVWALGFRSSFHTSTLPSWTHPSGTTSLNKLCCNLPGHGTASQHWESNEYRVPWAPCFLLFFNFLRLNNFQICSVSTQSHSRAPLGDFSFLLLHCFLVSLYILSFVFIYTFLNRGCSCLPLRLWAFLSLVQWLIAWFPLG